MNIEDLKKNIIALVKKSKDFDYIIAVYSFATNFPDNSKEEED